VRFQRVAYIKRIHRVISASALAISGKEVVSSLVFGDDFIHSYHFGVWNADSVSFLILRTYSTHGNMSHGSTDFWVFDSVPRTIWHIQTHLSVSCALQVSPTILTLKYKLVGWEVSLFGPFPKVWNKTVSIRLG